jgi:hypothetical protein
LLRNEVSAYMYMSTTTRTLTLTHTHSYPHTLIPSRVYTYLTHTLLHTSTHSKLGIMAMTKVLSRSNDGDKIMFNVVDPGYCATDQNMNHGYISAEKGAITPVALATLPKKRFVSGKLFYELQEIAW